MRRALTSTRNPAIDMEDVTLGRMLNLGILAHVDAGKTTLTERLLHAAGVIDEVGSADDGSTQTDTVALERRRGIAIKAAVFSFAIGDVAVNLIDAPGHPDFIAEVERALDVLDGAVLVVSAVEGVHAQTRVLMRALQRMRVPTLIFVNKTDRAGARPNAVRRGPARVSTRAAGGIAKLRGLAGARVGDAIGAAPAALLRRHFAPPTLEAVVVPRRAGDRRALRVALERLAEQDPLIALRWDDTRDELAVSLYGEVQKEVIEATPADEFGVAVDFRGTTTICIERPVGTGAAHEIIDTDSNPFLATVGLRVDRPPIGSGVAFRLEVELGAMPSAFFRAVEEAVRETLRRGLHGWRVTDCTVTMTHSGYAARQSHAHGTFDKSMSRTAGDFRALKPIVLMRALRRAGTSVHEPVHRFDREVPADTLGAVLPVLGRLGAVPGPPATHGAACTVAGEIPAARVHDLRGRLAALTRGEGVVETAFARHRPVRGAVPSREGRLAS